MRRVIADYPMNEMNVRSGIKKMSGPHTVLELPNSKLPPYVAPGLTSGAKCKSRGKAPWGKPKL